MMTKKIQDKDCSKIKQRKHNNNCDYRSQHYAKKFKEINPSISITEPLHTKIIITFFSIVFRKIVNDMYKFHFPGLGYFYLVKNKQEVKVDDNGVAYISTATNWKETNKIRKQTGDNTIEIKYTNEHTNGYVYSIYWDKKNMVFVNKRFYSFILKQPLQRYLAKIILSNTKPLNAYIR